MFTPAAAIKQSLATKKPLPRYLVALDMNIRKPDATARTKAPQVSGRIPRVTALTGRFTEATPEQPEIDGHDGADDQANREHMHQLDQGKQQIVFANGVGEAAVLEEADDFLEVQHYPTWV